MTTPLETKNSIDGIPTEESIQCLKQERNALLKEIQERDKKTESLLHGLSLIYHLMLLPNGSFANLDWNGESKSEDGDIQRNKEFNDINVQLDQLCERNYLHNTPFTLLLAAAQRLKSNLQHANNEAQVSQVQMLSLQKTNNLQSARLETMEAALKKLYSNNSKLKKKFSLLEEENSYLSSSLDGSTHASKIEKETILPQNEIKESLKEVRAPARIDLTVETNSIISSLTGCPSPISNQTGIKTLTLKYNDLHKSDESTLSSLDASPELLKQRKMFEKRGHKIGNEYKVTFDKKSKIGLHFYQMPVDEVGNILDKEDITKTRIVTKESGSSISPKLSFNRENMIDMPSPAKKAFLVCGYNDFDRMQNVCPPIGSRLINVNEDSFEEGDWTISKVIGRLSLDHDVILTFQDYSLTQKQLQVLKNASKKLEKAKREKEKQSTFNYSNDAPLLRDFSSSINDNNFHEKKNIAPSAQHKIPDVINTSSFVGRLRKRWQ